MKKIAVLMSGGIDSSFVALYLKKLNFDIFGITFLQIGGKEQKEDLKRARDAAKIISIPHFAIKEKSIFAREVILPFCSTFQKGQTPNPCSFCNKKIKFGVILRKAEKLGAEKIATGHYVRIRKEKLNYKLYKGKDSIKDQSYFLWQLGQKELKKALFPLGEFTKSQVWQEIKKSSLSKIFKEKNNSDGYSESQDICFLQNKDISKLLKEKFKKNPGKILNKNGNIVGRHDGIYFFTIGQRSGLKIGAKSPRQRPFYVVDIKNKENAIIVGSENDLYKKNLVARKINWTFGKAPNLPIQIQAQIRYHSKPAPATIGFSENLYKVEFKNSQRAITSGQDIVFYKKDLLLGGGVINRSF